MSLHIAVIGKTGQLARALQARALAAADTVSIDVLGRPELDLVDAASVRPALAGLRADIVVNTAAYTAVDRAEKEEEVAHRINAEGAEELAAAVAAFGVPIIHVSTDYVFDGSKAGAYDEDDPVAPLGAYGRSKLAGERAIIAANPRHVVLRTAWLYSETGRNFLLTMLRLARERSEVSVVDDQHGNPTYAGDLADGILSVAANVAARADEPRLYGVFHMAAPSDTTWCGFAKTIMAESAARGGPSAEVRPTTTAGYPTLGRRPANSRLDCTRLATVHGVRLPTWRDGLSTCLDRVFGNATESPCTAAGQL